ncbi:MAG: hypothetical protein DME33_02330 [Verrucomicrobia bacterium]|nr:MAG: hypothetical protein DME33_02330 [Verrucomicrobiota bacterium]
MRRPDPATIICVILGILFLTIGYNFATLPHLVVWLDQHQRTFTRANNPVVFWIPAIGAFAVAAICLLVAYHLHFRVQLAHALIQSPAILRRLPFTRRLWLAIYLTSAVLTVWRGYKSLSPEKTAHTNSDWIFVSITFVLACLFPLGAVAYSRLVGVDHFRRPSLDRHPFGWWRDTLQPLRVTVIGTALYFLGACFALPHANQRGVMVFWFYVALALGLFIGERAVYLFYRVRIA